MTSRLSRRSLLAVAAGGLAVTALPSRSARAATDDELAYANFGLAAAYLAADFYGRALEAAATLHARALSDLIAGAADTPAAAEDFEFQWPDAAFASAASTRTTGLAILRAMLGAYQSAAATVAEQSYRVLYASLVASIAEQIGALAAPGGEGARPFPVALDLEAASAALEPYLG